MKHILRLLLPLGWFVLIISSFARIQHWSDTPLFYQLSYVVIAISYAYRYWTKQNLRFTDTVKTVLIVFYCALNISFATRVIFDSVVLYAFFLLGTIWFVSEIFDLFKGRTKGHRLILLIGASFLAIQIAFRIMHWPGAGVINLMAPLIISIGFAAETVHYFRRLKAN